MAISRVRRNGSFAPLSAHYYKDDAIDEAGPEAELLYVRGLAFCAEMLSDGYISNRQLTRFVGIGLPNVLDRANALVKVSLWEHADGGYVVRSWLEWNLSKAEIEGQKAAEAARKIPLDVRKQVLERDSWTCRSCGSKDEIQIDHLYPWSLGGQHEMDNLQVLCGPCNRRKGARV